MDLPVAMESAEAAASMSVDPDAEEVCSEGKPGCTDPHLTEAQKAKVLDDFVAAFADDYWDITEGWVLIDGSAEMPEATSELLAKMLHAKRHR
jgi:hypothetical protein